MKKTAIFLCALLLFLLIPISSYSMDYSEEEYNETLSSYDLSSFEKELEADTHRSSVVVAYYGFLCACCEVDVL